MRYLLILGFLVLAGCNSTKIVAYDKPDRLVTIEGRRSSSEADFQARAEEYCHGPASLLRMQEVAAGSYNPGVVQFAGRTAFMNSASGTVKRPQKTFHCD